MRLQVQDLDFGFSQNLLFENVQLELSSGKNLCLNTSVLDGASSFLKCLAGIFKPVRGCVQIDGNSVHHMSNEERILNVAYCYEHGGLVSTFTILNNILFPIRYHGLMGEREARTYIIDTAEQLDIVDLLNKEPYQLNDVQTRLVNVLRGLCMRPKLLLLDEVQNGMSHEYINTLIEVLLQHQRNIGFAMIMATTAGDSTAFADHVARVNQRCIEVIQ